MSQKAFTLRLPEEIYQRIREIGGSASGYIVKAIEEKLERDRRETVRRGFMSLASSHDEEADMWIAAQGEAMKHVDS